MLDDITYSDTYGHGWVEGQDFNPTSLIPAALGANVIVTDKIVRNLSESQYPLSAYALKILREGKDERKPRGYRSLRLPRM